MEWVLLKREGYSQKKKTGHASKQRHGDVKAGRRVPIAGEEKMSGDDLVLIDECLANTEMACSQGWAKRCQRCGVSSPNGHRYATTVVAAFRKEGFIASPILDGATNGDRFRARIRDLVKSMRM